MTDAYGVSVFLPGHQLLGLRWWDDLILVSASGDAFTCPSVPAASKYFESFDLSTLPTELIADERFAGKFKWYIKPIVFGGNPELDSNIIWVPLEKHAELVKWWNQMYLEIAPSISPH